MAYRIISVFIACALVPSLCFSVNQKQVDRLTRQSPYLKYAERVLVVDPCDYPLDCVSYGVGLINEDGKMYALYISSELGYFWEHILYHEFFGYVWSNWLNQYERDAWTKIFNEAELFPTAYSKTSPHNNFEEWCVLFFTDVPMMGLRGDRENYKNSKEFLFLGNL